MNKIEKLERQLAIAKQTLNDIKVNQYGLQGLIEDGEPEEKITEYYVREISRYRKMAWGALNLIKRIDEEDNG